VAVKEKLRIKLRGYDAQLVDASAQKIVETAKRTGARCQRPHSAAHQEAAIVTILRSVPTSTRTAGSSLRLRVHKRLIDVLRPSQQDGGGPAPDPGAALRVWRVEIKL
jgi:small subunit ribosomal protein S10